MSCARFRGLVGVLGVDFGWFKVVWNFRCIFHFFFVLQGWAMISEYDCKMYRCGGRREGGEGEKMGWENKRQTNENEAVWREGIRGEKEKKKSRLEGEVEKGHFDICSVYTKTKSKSRSIPRDTQMSKSMCQENTAIFWNGLMLNGVIFKKESRLWAPFTASC